MIHCWRYRRIISRSADEDVPLPPAAQAHVAQCGRCRRVYVTEHQLVRRLRLGAAAQKGQQPAPFLQARIMARIASSEAGARRASKPSSVGWRLALATACIVLATLSFSSGLDGPGLSLSPLPARSPRSSGRTQWKPLRQLTGLTPSC